MRTFILIIAAACCMLACKKSETVSPGLFGKWELRRSVGSIAGYDSTYKAGNGTIMQFKSDSTFAYYIKGKLTSQGTFHIKTFIPPSGPYQEIVYNNNTSGPPFNMQGTQLTIGEDFDDGVASSYQKIQNE